ncbi:MAG TPA: glycosyltransferase family 4 protein [Chitinophagaceae bacterium]|nr:glycosyltransferase family 4 protein [Chitinophagaceae bacterium]
MKVLWFTNTPSLYKENSHHYNGAGWIKSLEEMVITVPGIELGVSFYHPEDGEKCRRGNTTYYPILRKKGSPLRKLYHNWKAAVEPKADIQRYLEVIRDFKPDIIQIFGTESSFAAVQPFTDIPVVIHLQGLISPYENTFYPAGINRYNILFEPRFFKRHLLGNSLLFDRKRFNKQAKRELSYFKASRYLMGRTGWDKLVSALLAPQSVYFHVDEVLRSIFYSTPAWRPADRNKLIIVSTISRTIYKGLDLVLKTAKLLKEHTALSFEWQVAGLSQDDIIVSFFERQLGITCKDCNVILTGVKDDVELIQMQKAADVFVHPSYIENSPNSVCEAQLLGMPVIACNAGGVSSLIESGVNGILVPANAPYDLAAQVKKLANEKTYAAELGKQGRIAAQQRHDRKKILSDLIEAYEAIVNKRSEIKKVG